MTVRGFLAVSSFCVSILVTNVAIEAPTFDWSHDPVISGTSMVVKVKVAPCHPVTVLLVIDGVQVQATIAELPGECTLQVPPGTAGAGYTLSVFCGTDRSTETGQVL